MTQAQDVLTMTRARKTILSLNATPYYHVVARCVRRAWLCGIDEYAGKGYSHQDVDQRAHTGDTHRFLLTRPV
jgi:hypothetical protein